MRKLALLPILILILAAASSLAAISEFKEQGISFDGPQNWSIRSSGSEPNGSIALSCPDENLSLFWVRNAGLKPEKYLDQAAGAYQSSKLSVVSQKKGTRNVSGSEAVILGLDYEFKGHRSKKLFASWNSDKSDRTFLAVLSGFGDNYTWDEKPFDIMLETFQDLSPAKLQALAPRAGINDSWGSVLQDVLSSCHYLDPSTLPRRTTSIQVALMLSASGKRYRLSSEEDLSASLPPIMAIRPSVVQQVLIEHGYKAQLAQWNGVIWVIVKDPSGMWQSISVNPKEPSRTIGVLIKPEESQQRAMVYEDLADLQKSNGIKIEGPIQADQYVEKDCDPSEYVELKSPEKPDSAWIKELSDRLDSRGYTGKYSEGAFDCSNVSQICWSMLQGWGYDARLMFSYQGHPLGAHMWVAVKYPYEADRYVAIEATNVDKNGDLVHLGRVVFKPEYYKGIMYNTSIQFSRLQPSEGLWLSPFSSAVAV